MVFRERRAAGGNPRRANCERCAPRGASMRSCISIVGLGLIAASALGPAIHASEPYAGRRALIFERNDGQFADGVRFVARGDGYRVKFLPDRLLLAPGGGAD